jgi:hypothetical protein
MFLFYKSKALFILQSKISMAALPQLEQMHFGTFYVQKCI